ncbi:universal stress protein [Flavobacteriaceae bacterium]|jgi:nucleotide-binding universal stress UspA family protein|nr:universal stress protein [Flavobacteriaceae bacterium]MDA9328056.1 universal stress protein [Flavobacteriaceae bacterium]MDB4025095.1 universal stress protein [Flavobacteriaceae bacterium]
MNHILVPIGSKENASNTLQYAIDFAKEIGAKVFVFRAYKVLSKAGTFININDILERETNLYIQTMISSVDTKGVDVKMISAKGGTVESINSVHEELGIDLIVVGPRSNSIKEEVFLGSTSGSIVKQTEIPVLIVPEHYKFSPFKVALTAFKSGILEQQDVLTPLQEIKSLFKTKINLLLVKTPEYKEEDLVVDASLKALQNTFSTSENVTTFQGVLEHFQSNNPDLLCVFRRKKGFFQKLWEKNTVLKSEFHCSIPLLILSGRQ